MNATAVKDYHKPSARGQGRTLGGIRVEWVPDARAASHGGLVYFARFLRGTGPLGKFLSPPFLSYSSPNAPSPVRPT